MTAKSTEVVLVCQMGATQVSRAFNAGHAARLLRMPRNGGWRLPDDSPFEFDGNGFGYKTDCGAAEKPAKKGRNK